MRVPQVVTYAAVDKGMELKGEQIKPSVDTMMQALELLRLAKRHFSRQSNVEQ